MDWLSWDQAIFTTGLLLAAAGSLAPLASAIARGGPTGNVANWRRRSLWIALIGVCLVLYAGWDDVPTVEQIGKLAAHYPWTVRGTAIALVACALSSTESGGKALLAVAMAGVFGVAVKTAGVLWPQGGGWLVGGIAIAYAAAWLVGAAFLGLLGARKHLGVIGVSRRNETAPQNGLGKPESHQS